VVITDELSIRQPSWPEAGSWVSGRAGEIAKRGLR
jgi:hypothetical protein